MSIVRLLTFRLSGQRLALATAEVKRVAAAPRLDPAPGAPAFLEGFFSLHGTPVAAVRLDRLIGLAEARLGIYAPLILLAAADPPVALRVQAVDSILATADADIRATDEAHALNGCVAGQVSSGGEQVFLLTASRLLLERERQALAAHAAMIERRLADLGEPHDR